MNIGTMGTNSNHSTSFCVRAEGTLSNRAFSARVQAGGLVQVGTDGAAP